MLWYKIYAGLCHVGFAAGTGAGQTTVSVALVDAVAGTDNKTHSTQHLMKEYLKKQFIVCPGCSGFI